MRPHSLLLSVEARLVSRGFATLCCEVFKELYLATVNMSHNQIEFIPAGTFIQCDNLTLGKTLEH